ncbi:MAG TPA: phytanoyl-CoA dioxygenase family protein [Saprospiraceae bacterium]|nr:phytanoyl-CoA dioxygenase family protein [Saprospiraceae bacterium]
MNDQKYHQDFWEQGYLVIENFFRDELMDHLNEVTLTYFGRNPEWEHSDDFIQKSATEVIPWFPLQEGNTDFQAIEADERLKSLTQKILGEGSKSLYLMVMFSKKGTQGQAWHQDSPPEDPTKFNLNRLFYTHDINEKTGGQVVVYPGSHKMGELPTGKPDENLEHQIVLSPKKGTLVILHGHCWHRVLPVNGEHRVSANARAIPKGTPEDITDVAVYRNMRYRFSTQEVIEER